METGEALNGLAGLVGRFADLIPPFQAMIVAACFLLGIIMAINSIRGFARASETNAAGQGSLAGASVWQPTVTLIIAVLLVSLSSAISAFLVSLFQQEETVAASEIFAYAPEMLQPLDHEQSRTVVIALLRIVQFIGLIGFIRGLFLMNKSAYRGPYSGLFGQGFTHVIGGVLAMNIVQFLGMIEALVIE
ncbi:hypothetical protein [Shinella sumterensis]|jgi:hypothetical protein|uniref:Uncharacterized protein n=1 Tax=Shinella sumterensis TaxID=1967501 RepID=A0AA50CRE1_9HYPH|nr:hypothetical protein [Shinella sumterensis]WLS01371.1 hypothetical protein Q9313_28655 [Shinella sumterensis]